MRIDTQSAPLSSLLGQKLRKKADFCSVLQ